MSVYLENDYIEKLEKHEELFIQVLKKFVLDCNSCTDY